MSQPKGQGGQEEAASSSQRAVLKTRTAFQIYRNDGAAGSAAAFSTLPNDEVLPYRIKADEMTLMAALDVVEADARNQRMYGPATLHLVVNYLSDLLSFIPLGGRSHVLRTVTINYNALQRVVELYGATEAVKGTLAQLATACLSASEVPIREISSFMDHFSVVEKSLRQEMRDAGEKVGMFSKSTAPASSLTTVGDTTINDVIPSVFTQTASRKRLTPTWEETSAAGGTEEANTATPVKWIKTEGGKKASGSAKNTSTQFTLQRMLYGRLRALTSQEKKVVTLLNQLVQILGQVYAVRYNNLLPIFELLENKVKQAQEIVDAERSAFQSKYENTDKSPEPFLEVTLDGIMQAIQNASHLFKTDEECRYEFDEDLLHPIAHACMTEVNRIEGFTTVPFEGPSEEALEAKANAREAARAKREEQRTKALERAKAKEELTAKKEEERKLIRAHLGELDSTSLMEDMTIKNPVKSAYVRYNKLPLEPPEEYERALFIWAMLTSLPRPLHISQMPFHLFLKGLLSDEGRDNGLMEEVVLALLDVARENLRSSNGPKISTRGRDWFGSMVEFVAVSSGNKKSRPPPRPKAISYDDDDDEDESDEAEEEEEDSQNMEEEEEEEEEAADADEAEAVSSNEEKDREKQMENGDEAGQREEKEEECRIESLDGRIKVTLEHVTELRHMAAWGNVDMEDRLNLLQYMVLEALSSPAAQEEAEKMRKMHEEMKLTMEKRTKEIREGAHKEITSLLKQFSSSSKSENDNSETYEARREKLFEKMEQKLQNVVSEYLGMQDGKDVGALICPLGMDRYRRMYWRFPFDRHILVQSTAATDTNFPILPEPRERLTQHIKGLRPMLLDDADEIEHNFKNVNGEGHTNDRDDVPQRVWGVVPPEYLDHFIEGLDRRGIREAGLRRSLESIRPYLLSLSEPPVGRMTRTRSHTFGYFNKLKLEL
ncbi:putative nucleoplasmin-like protein (NLP) [Trypanosoma rangeli]|uniref:Putative nucleoplasmin-like protein (NLP) n=1 Tax=Trypanosoma rangeli TaxID=5698 RepID=A0A422NTX5_TRYRA|nr:putative nucleoplasmin-like protein (NLP) [Trypanosoma rangeli]RNF08912.1 putative nucleoplasmin-like protein (NLP) [Trypanosoma rangeli]|eukprot:RNF08912.1 putative nucleoplasmin-like protein (NLP) [Trypanosoma rangeli]